MQPNLNPQKQRTPINPEAISFHIEEQLESLRRNNANEGENISQHILTSARVNLNEELSTPPVCLQIICNGQICPFSTLGNFSAVIGKAKAKKSFLITMLISCAIQDGSPSNVIQCVLPEGKKVVGWFDTEQSKYHVMKAGKRALQLAKQNEALQLHIFSLRGFNTEQRFNAIEYYIHHTPELGLLVIDGIRDISMDINDSKDAMRVVGHLMRWSEEYHIHILIVLHQNKNDSNARGHLGTEITNKAETIISVTKIDDKVSRVEAEYCRDKEFEAFAISVNQEGLPYVVEAPLERFSSRREEIRPQDIPKEKHLTYLKKIFILEKNLTYRDFCKALVNVMGEDGTAIGQSKAKIFVAYYTQNSYVRKKEKQIGNCTFHELHEQYNYLLNT